MPDTQLTLALVYDRNHCWLSGIASLCSLRLELCRGEYTSGISCCGRFAVRSLRETDLSLVIHQCRLAVAKMIFQLFDSQVHKVCVRHVDRSIARGDSLPPSWGESTRRKSISV